MSSSSKGGVLQQYPKVPRVILQKRLGDFPQFRKYTTKMSDTGAATSLLPPLEAKEMKFSVPWGHIAAREYGDPDGIPVLALHGWLDNCGSFEPLMPYIVGQSNLHVIALDEPGCGMSSHIGVGVSYSRWGFLKDIRRVLNVLKWKKVTLLGHSQGGHYSLLFASVFPELVERVITIDIEKPVTYSVDSWREKMVRIIERQLQMEDVVMASGDISMDSTAPVYSEEDALKRIMEGHGNSLNEESARALMKRGTKPHKSGITFSRDLRQKLPNIDPLPTDETLYKLMQGIACDLQIIRGSKSIYVISEDVRSHYYELYTRNCPLFESTLLEGTHHLHMNNPDTVGPVINQFIAKSLALKDGPITEANSLGPKSNL